MAASFFGLPLRQRNSKSGNRPSGLGGAREGPTICALRRAMLRCGRRSQRAGGSSPPELEAMAAGANWMSHSAASLLASQSPPNSRASAFAAANRSALRMGHLSVLTILRSSR